MKVLSKNNSLANILKTTVNKTKQNKNCRYNIYTSKPKSRVIDDK